jgi:hypothetical protein
MPFLRMLMIIALAAPWVLGQRKYTGPRPDKSDVPYLLHAANLVATEEGDAKEEDRKDDVANVIPGASSRARTPLAEPIFLFEADKIQPEKLELYRVAVKAGSREVAIPKSLKKRKDGPRPLRLAFTKLDATLYRIEANQFLENGEYCMSPSGSSKVFCFQVY